MMVRRLVKRRSGIHDLVALLILICESFFRNVHVLHVAPVTKYDKTTRTPNFSLSSSEKAKVDPTDTVESQIPARNLILRQLQIHNERMYTCQSESTNVLDKRKRREDMEEKNSLNVSPNKMHS